MMCPQEPATCMSEVCVLRRTWQTREPPCILSNRAPSLQLTVGRVGMKDQHACAADFTKETRNPKENKSLVKEKHRDFPGSPVVKTLCFQWRRQGFDP